MNRLYQINIRHFLYENNYTSVLQIPDYFWSDLKKLGFNWVWLLGCWQIAHRSVDKAKAIFDQYPEDRIIGSCFAIEDYTVDSIIGGENDLILLKDKLNNLGIRLMLDFIPNHFGLSESLLQSNPNIFLRTESRDYKFSFDYQNQFFALGRDPNFDPWQDTLQLDYSKLDTHQFMLNRLHKVSLLCDGVRCDMTMLVLPQIFERTWNKPVTTNFWLDSIPKIKLNKPNFVFLAEVYWNLESELLSCGFDYFYNKTWLDNILYNNWSAILDNSYQSKSLFFLENHDEKRIASHFVGSKLLLLNIFLLVQQGLQLWQNDQIKGAITKWTIQILPIIEETFDPNVELILSKWLEKTKDWELINITLVGNNVLKLNIQSGQILFFNFGKSSYHMVLNFLNHNQKYQILNSQLNIVSTELGKDLSNFVLEADCMILIESI